MSAELESRHSDYLAPYQFFAAWGEATGRYFDRRASTLEAARPRQGDFHGRASRESLQARYDRLTAQAEACRHRAEVARLYGATPADRALMVDVATALVVTA